jgi:autotransporter-associated beta strand protein
MFDQSFKGRHRRATKRVRIVEFAALGISIGLTPTFALAQSVDIPLNYAVNTGFNYGVATSNHVLILTINVGVNGGAAQPYAFDTGSAVFLTPGGTFAGASVLASGVNIDTYAGTSTFSGNVYQVTASSLKFYATPGATSGGISLGLSGNYNAAAYTALNGNVPSTNPFGTATVGVFGAGAQAFTVGGTNVGLGGIFGQMVPPNTTAGYVVSANGQSLAALNAQLGTNIPGGPAGSAQRTVSLAVTNCNPCVTVGLTPALLAQFLPLNTVNAPASGKLFPNSGVQGIAKFVPFNFTLNSGSAPGTPVRFSRNVSLDTGWSGFTLQHGGNFADPVLTMAANSGGTQEAFNIASVPGEPSPYRLANTSDSNFVGIGFFVENSVLFDLAGQQVGYSPNFVTDANISTTQPLVIDSSSVPLGLAGIISGPGGISIGAGGSATLSGTNTYTGPTSISGADAYLALVGPGTISASSGVDVSAGGTFDVSGVTGGATIKSLSGDANGLVWLGSNRLILSDANGTFAGAIVGIGGLTLTGGTETLTGTSMYTGVTNIVGGTLRAGAVDAFAPISTFALSTGTTLDLNGFNQEIGSLVGAGNVTLGSATLTTGGNNSNTAFDGVIFGTGGLVKVGSGAFALTATNAYTGATDINAGILQVPGSIAASSLTNINNGGRLTGTGTVGNLQVNSGGTFAPGRAGTPGTAMTVAGNLSFNSGSTFAIELMPTQDSHANVTGMATINGGTVQLTPQLGTYNSNKIALLTSTGALTGTFNPNLAYTNSVNLNGASLSYDSHHVYLSAATDDALIPPPGGNVVVTLAAPSNASANSQTVTAAINQFILSGANLPGGFQNLANLSSTALNNATLQLAGQTQGSAAPVGFTAGSQFLNLILNPHIEGRGAQVGAAPAPLAYADEPSAAPATTAFKAFAVAPAAGFTPNLSMWASAYGGTGTISGNAVTGAANTSSQVYGFATGLDYQMLPQTVVGFALGGGGTAWQLGQGSGNGSGNGRSDMFQAGLYGTSHFGQAYVSAAAAYSLQDVTTTRNVTLDGFDTLKGDFAANVVSGRLESGYRLPYGLVSVTPYGAVQTQAMFLPSYGEHSQFGTSTQFALSYASHTFNATRTELGAWIDSDALLPRWPERNLKLYGRVAWAHDFDNEGSSTAFFQSLSGASFLVNSVKPARDGALVTAGLEYKPADGWSLLGKFEGEYSRTTAIFAGSGTIKKVW